MEYHKKLGSITMAISIILALASIAFSESDCYERSPNNQSTVKWVLFCLRVVVYVEIYADNIYIPTKYILLTCATIYAVGALWYKGALPVPKKLMNIL